MATKRLKMPSENVEYTFRFPPHRKITYRWFGDEKAKGRLVFYNVTGKYYTAMTVIYFNHLLSNRLIEKRDVPPLPETPERKEREKPSLQPKEPKAETSVHKREPEKDLNKIEPLSADERSFLNARLLSLLSLSDQWKNYCRKQLEGYTVEKLCFDIKNGLSNGLSENEFLLIISRLNRIDSVIFNLKKKLGGAWK